MKRTYLTLEPIIQPKYIIWSAQTAENTPTLGLEIDENLENVVLVKGAWRSKILSTDYETIWIPFWDPFRGPESLVVG